MSIQELQTSRLDINNNYEIDVTLKQLDDIVLKIIVYDKSLPADLSNYTARLKAFKSDQVPLIQNTQIYIDNNEVTIIGDPQLGTTSGIVKAELQFINKTTFEKKSTFYININVVASVLETDRGISVATCTLLKEIDNKLDQIENIGNVLEDAIEVNNELKDTTTPAAHAANLELQSTIDDANISKLALDASNENATNTKNTLDALNTDAINTKNALDISKDDAETIKESLETFVSEHQDVTAISNQLNNISSQMLDIMQEQTTQNNNILLKADNTDFNRTTTDKTVTGSINELNANKLNKTEFNASVGNLAKAEPLFADSTINMTDTTRLYVNISDGYIYYYNGSAWTNTGKQYQSKVIDIDSVGIQEIKGTDNIINIFDKNDITLNYRMDIVNGVFTMIASSGYAVSGFIRVFPGQHIYINNTNMPKSSASIITFDVNENAMLKYFTSTDWTSYGAFVVPDNVYSIRIALNSNKLSVAGVYTNTDIAPNSLDYYKSSLSWLVVNESNLDDSLLKLIETKNVISVKKDGTGDFTSLRSAISSITDNTIENEIEIYEGTYDILSDYTTEEINSANCNGSASGRCGLIIPKHAKLRGSG